MRSAGRARAMLRGLTVVLAAIVAAGGCAPAARRRVPLEPAIAARVEQFGPAARARLAPFFAAAGVAYPPPRFVLIGFKLERELQLLAARPDGGLVFVRSYSILGASG